MLCYHDRTMDRAETLRELLAETETEIATTRKERDELSNRLDRLEKEREGLRLVLSRHTGTQLTQPDWRPLTRIAAVEKVLRLAGNPLAPKEITKRLRSTGRDDEYPLVSAALAYMKRQGVVESAGYGLWKLAPDHSSGPVDDFDEEEVP